MWGKDHYASTCPAKRRFSATNSTRSPAASPMHARPSARFPAPQHAPFLDPQIARSASQATEFCRNFNFRVCSFSGCRRIHRCFKCNQPHPASSCTSSQNWFILSFWSCFSSPWIYLFSYFLFLSWGIFRLVTLLD